MSNFSIYIPSITHQLLVYYTIGRYDMVAMVETPTDEVMASMPI
jgi:uncharacterized protein with GYD domain